MRVKEVAELVGISVRTLHHYDEIGLFPPGETSASGYRLYTDENLETLQQILFFRELGFPLKQIKSILEQPTYDRREALEMQHSFLIEKRKRIDQMIATIEKTIKHTKGEIPMTNKEKFEGFDFSQNPYEQEARERWGDAAVDQSNAKLGKMSGHDQEALSQEMHAIYTKLAELRTSPPDSAQSQAAIREWYEMLNRMGSYPLEAFRALGQMYVDDARFTKNIDKYGEGLAIFMRDAMAEFADRNR